jgi:3-isopropylmalate/(R)-2-methylmalate dehydratase small subunit
VIIAGPAVIVPGDNIDTDVLYPGSYLNIDDPAEMKPYLFEGLDPKLCDLLRPSCVLVVGDNFGSGSSREHVPLAMKAWGVGCVLGRSFARIFHRNCINLGLPAITCPDAVEVATSSSVIRIDSDAGVVDVDGSLFDVPPVPQFMRALIEAGGLVPWTRRRLEAAEA